jgi:hypothetical protein
MSNRTIDYATLSQRPSQAWLICGITACCIAVVAIIAPIPSIVEVASWPPGTPMRPMGALMMMFFGRATGLLAVSPLALLCLIKGWHRRAGRILGLIGFLLGAVAIFGDSCVFDYIFATRGYIMAP